MKLTYNEFEIITIIEREKIRQSQRKLSKLSGFSLGKVNKIISSLLEKELITNDNMITEKGLLALEPYRVKRAIFLAAGFGSRMVPITLKTPKPLVLVHGKRIIETLLDAVVKAEIPEIIIVTGYLGEQFKMLQKKYKNIKLIYNEMYNEANSISSIYLVKNMLQNSYVLESDLILYNQKVIRKYEYKSNFLGFYTETTDDWCSEIKNGIIKKFKIGGSKCYQMVGIAYYDEKDGQKLSIDIDNIYNLPGGKEKCWDQIPLDVCKNNYKIHIRECQKEDIKEIDTFNELKQIDKTYNL